MRTPVLYVLIPVLVLACSMAGNSPSPCSACPHGTAAMIIVTLPSDANLSFDDYPTSSTGARRSFITPPLEVGKDYTYTLKAEFGAQKKAQTKTITVRAGRITEVSLGEGAGTPPSDLP